MLHPFQQRHLVIQVHRAEDLNSSKDLVDGQQPDTYCVLSAGPSCRLVTAPVKRWQGLATWGSGSEPASSSSCSGCCATACRLQSHASASTSKASGGGPSTGAASGAGASAGSASGAKAAAIAPSAASSGSGGFNQEVFVLREDDALVAGMAPALEVWGVGRGGWGGAGGDAVMGQAEVPLLDPELMDSLLLGRVALCRLPLLPPAPVGAGGTAGSKARRPSGSSAAAQVAAGGTGQQQGEGSAAVAGTGPAGSIVFSMWLQKTELHEALSRTLPVDLLPSCCMSALSLRPGSVVHGGVGTLYMDPAVMYLRLRLVGVRGLHHHRRTPPAHALADASGGDWACGEGGGGGGGEGGEREEGHVVKQMQVLGTHIQRKGVEFLNAAGALFARMGRHQHHHHSAHHGSGAPGSKAGGSEQAGGAKGGAVAAPEPGLSASPAAPAVGTGAAVTAAGSRPTRLSAMGTAATGAAGAGAAATAAAAVVGAAGSGGSFSVRRSSETGPSPLCRSGVCMPGAARCTLRGDRQVPPGAEDPCGTPRYSNSGVCDFGLAPPSADPVQTTGVTAAAVRQPLEVLLATGGGDGKVTTGLARESLARSGSGSSSSSGDSEGDDGDNDDDSDEDIQLESLVLDSAPASPMVGHTGQAQQQHGRPHLQQQPQQPTSMLGTLSRFMQGGSAARGPTASRPPLNSAPSGSLAVSPSTTPSLLSTSPQLSTAGVLTATFPLPPASLASASVRSSVAGGYCSLATSPPMHLHHHHHQSSIDVDGVMAALEVNGFSVTSTDVRGSSYSLFWCRVFYDGQEHVSRMVGRRPGATAAAAAGSACGAAGGAAASGGSGLVAWDETLYLAATRPAPRDGAVEVTLYGSRDPKSRGKQIALLTAPLAQLMAAAGLGCPTGSAAACAACQQQQEPPPSPTAAGCASGDAGAAACAASSPLPTSPLPCYDPATWPRGRLVLQGKLLEDGSPIELELEVEVVDEDDRARQLALPLVPGGCCPPPPAPPSAAPGGVSSNSSGKGVCVPEAPAALQPFSEGEAIDMLLGRPYNSATSASAVQLAGSPSAPSGGASAPGTPSGGSATVQLGGLLSLTLKRAAPPPPAPAAPPAAAPAAAAAASTLGPIAASLLQAEKRNGGSGSGSSAAQAATADSASADAPQPPLAAAAGASHVRLLGGMAVTWRQPGDTLQVAAARAWQQLAAQQQKHQPHNKQATVEAATGGSAAPLGASASHSSSDDDEDSPIAAQAAAEAASAAAALAAAADAAAAAARGQDGLGACAVGVLHLTLHGAEVVEPKGPVDTFAMFRFGRVWGCTSVSRSTRHPSWGWHLALPIPHPATSLSLALFRRQDSTGGKKVLNVRSVMGLMGPGDVLVGKLRLRASTLTPGRPHTVDLPLQGERQQARAGGVAGTARVTVMVSYPRLLPALMAYLDPPLYMPVHMMCMGCVAGDDMRSPFLGRPQLEVSEEALGRRARRVVLGWLEGGCAPGLPHRTARRLLDDGRQEFCLSRTQVNWRRVAAACDAMKPLGEWWKQIQSWRQPALSMTVAAVISLSALFPARALAAGLLWCCWRLARYRAQAVAAHALGVPLPMLDDADPLDPALAAPASADAAASTAAGTSSSSAAPTARAGASGTLTPATGGGGATPLVAAGWEDAAAVDAMPPLSSSFGTAGCAAGMASIDAGGGGGSGSAVPQQAGAVPLDPFATVKAQYDNLVRFMIMVQNVLDTIASWTERVQALCTWQDPTATALLLLSLLASAAVVAVVGLPALLAAMLLFDIRPPPLRDPHPPPPLNLLGCMPSRADRMM